MSYSSGKIQLQVVSSFQWYVLSVPDLLVGVYQISYKGVGIFVGHPV